jgi:hypothetical protein
VSTFSRKDQFYKEFQQETQVPENKAHNLSILTKTNLLAYENSMYSFNHNYIYYFFVSKYLADNIDDEFTKEIIGNLTKRLYRSEFANIIIFLIHHSKKEFIIDNVITEAQKIFSNFLPMTFTEIEIENINKLIDEDLKFLLKDKTPQHTRGEKLKGQDKLEAKNPIKEDRDVARHDEDVFVLNMFEKINLSRKLMEILGQIAKNYYGSLKGVVKYNLIDETIKLGMRALNSFIKDMDAHKKVLYNNIETVIRKKSIVEQDKLQSICNKTLFNFATLISCSFINLTSKSIVSKNLTPIYESVYADNKHISIKLINIATQLNFSDGLDVKDITDFHAEIIGNRMAEALLKLLVMNHLYMFDIDFRKKQSVCSKLGIGGEKLEQMKLLDKKQKNNQFDYMNK